MRKLGTKVAALMTAAALAVGITPTAAMAADGDAVNSASEMAEALAAGDEKVTLGCDITITSDEYLTITSGVVIDLNGHAITLPDNSDVDEFSADAIYDSLFTVDTSEKVVIENGSFLGGGGNSGILATVADNSNVLIDGLYVSGFEEKDILEMSGVSAEFEYPFSLVYVEDGNLTITDSTFENNERRPVMIGKWDIEDNQLLTSLHGKTAGDFYNVSQDKTGSLVISGSEFIDNGNENGVYGGAVYACGAETVKISDTTFDGNYTYDSGGALALTGCGDTYITDCDFSSNTAYKDNYSDEQDLFYYLPKTVWGHYAGGLGDYSDWPGGGAADISNYHGNVTISGCAFDGNRAEFGDGGALNIVPSGKSGTFLINGNSFTENYAQFVGGGIAITDATDEDYAELVASAGEPSLHEAAAADGICDDFVDISCDVVFEDNEINYNSASYGGGFGARLYDLDSDVRMHFISGEFVGNEASDYGGAIGPYNTRGNNTCYFYNALVTDNTADKGGGVWTCGYSSPRYYGAFNGAIYGNAAETAADDIYYEGLNETTLAHGNEGHFYLYEHVFGDESETWYMDFEGARYADGLGSEIDLADYEGTSDTVCLHGELSDSAITIAESEATLIISGNSAGRSGGGIASNCVTVFGMEEDVDVNITKEWADASGNSIDADNMENVSVTLYQIDADGNSTEYITIELGRDNGWKYSFTALPAAYPVMSADGKDIVYETYTYEVAESESDMYSAAYAVSENADGDITVRITNTLASDEFIYYGPDDDSVPTADVNTTILWILALLSGMVAIVVARKRIAE